MKTRALPVHVAASAATILGPYVDELTPEGLQSALRQYRPGAVGDELLYVSPAEVARRLGVCRRTVFTWLRTGKLPRCRLAGSERLTRVRWADVLALVEPEAAGGPVEAAG